ncbi:AKT-interacting protein [Aspergillus lentulus]|nr:AKT-interacting protein [Aspergillus lentulus]
MSSSRLPNIPALRRQQLLLEFASLKHAAPPGIYISITPGDPTLWSGVIFVRSGIFALASLSEETRIDSNTGPYASAVLRFQIRFPDSYPELPPLVTFSTDVFHPLIVPLTTYTFSTGASTEDPVSATDEERLPPGGFSLRHCFPHWFGRARKTGRQSTGSSRPVSATGRNTDEGDTTTADGPSSPSSRQPNGAEEGDNITKDRGESASEARKTVPVAVLLNYIRSTFDDENILDLLPLEAAGNPSAWHAWKAHRRENSESATNSKRGSPQARLPGDWHWDGIWAKRVQHEIEASHSDQMLFGNAARGATDEMIRFSRLDDATLASIKETIIPPVGGAHE